MNSTFCRNIIKKRFTFGLFLMGRCSGAQMDTSRQDVGFARGMDMNL